MTLLENLSAYLQTNSIGTEGTTLFIGEIPAKVSNGVGLRQTGGLSPDKYVDVKAITVQIIVRNKVPKIALDKAYSIYALLHRKDDNLVLEAGGVDVMQILALQEPYDLGKDDEGRSIFVTNYVFRLRD